MHHFVQYVFTFLNVPLYSLHAEAESTCIKTKFTQKLRIYLCRICTIKDPSHAKRSFLMMPIQMLQYSQASTWRVTTMLPRNCRLSNRQTVYANMTIPKVQKAQKT